MAYIEPNTTVQFLNIPWDADYENTMYFESLTQQNEYMANRIIKVIDNNSYQRKNKGVLRVGWTADLQIPPTSVIHDLYNANYMRFKNTNFENKWFYAFVRQIEYVNNNTVDVYYEIDVLQTWHFNYQLLECFIERNHTLTDLVGENTVPENLEHGEYYTQPCNASNYTTNGMFDYTPAICVITTFNDEGEYSPGSRVNGAANRGDMYSGLQYRFFNLYTELDDLNEFLEGISGNANVITESGVKIPKFLSDGVVAVFMLPYEFAASYGGSTVPAKLLRFDILQSNLYKLGNYLPRNKKLMCYPYNFLYVTNFQGNSGEFRWEDFSSPFDASFHVWGNVSPNGGMICIPISYKDSGAGVENADESIQVTGFPLCPWTYDSFKAWLSQNAGTLGAGALALGEKWVTTLAGGPVGGLLSGNMDASGYVGQHTGANSDYSATPSAGLIGATAAAVGQVYDHARRPPQAKGNGNVSVGYQSGHLTFGFYRKHIKEEYAKIIDAFFDMYGYRINKVGIPGRANRQCYTYVKTIGCAIDGDLPAEDVKAIQAIYDRGIRFWRTTATFGSYDPSVNTNQVIVSG